MKYKFLLSSNASSISEAPNDTGELWFKVSKYGDFPNMAYNPKTKRSMQTVQRFDRQAATNMKKAFDSMITTVRHMGRGLPIYEGHADDPKLLSNPGHTMAAVGRIKELDVRDDGLWAKAVLNAQGIPMVKGDAAPYSATSPFWWTVDAGTKEGKASVTTPVQLESVALTNKPNISDNFIGLNQEPQSGDLGAPDDNKTDTHDTMKTIREKLGLQADASEDEVLTKIIAIMNENSALKREKGDVKTKLTEANTAKDAAEKSLDAYRTSETQSALNQAIEDGKITKAQRDQFEAVLNSDFAAGKALIDGLGKQAELNTTNHVGDLDKGTATKSASLNSAMSAHAAKHNLDLSNQAHYDQAYDAVRKDVYAEKK